jgi:hypothetical protein
MDLSTLSRPAEPNRQQGEKVYHWGGLSWIWHLLYIIYSLEVGLVLIFLPWLAIWDNNYLLYLFPHFRPLLANAFLKGAVLGLGIVNILIGIQEIVRFKKNSRNYFSK